MNFKNAETIDTDLATLVKSERKITHEILLHINLAETLRVYAKLGYSNIFQYLTKRHGYAEDAAYRRIRAARLMKSSPAVAEKIQSGEVNLSQTCKIEQMIKKSEIPIETKHTVVQELIQKIEHKNLFETEQILAQELQISPIQQDKVKPQMDGSVNLQVTLCAEQMAKLEQVKSLMSHQLPNGKWADVIDKLCDTYLNKRTDLKVASKSKLPKPSSISKKLQTTLTKNEVLTQTSRYIPISIKRSIYHRANGCCEMVINGQRCNSRYQLQYDHQKPISLGGASTTENIRLLCRTHNLSEAQRLGVSQTH